MLRTLDLLERIPMATTVFIVGTDIEISHFPCGENGSFIFRDFAKDKMMIVPGYSVEILYCAARAFGINGDAIIEKKPATNGIASLLDSVSNYERRALVDRLELSNGTYQFKEIYWLDRFGEKCSSIGFKSVTISNGELQFECISRDYDPVDIDESFFTFGHYYYLLEGIENEAHELP